MKMIENFHEILSLEGIIMWMDGLITLEYHLYPGNCGFIIFPCCCISNSRGKILRISCAA